MDKEQFRSLPEKLRRLVLGQETEEIGRGGVSQIARKYRASLKTPVFQKSTTYLRAFQA